MKWPSFINSFFLLAMLLATTKAAGSEEFDVVKQSLNEKGLPASAIQKRAFTPGRPLPPVRYLSPTELPFREKGASVQEREVQVSLRQRSNSEFAAFGFPFPQGALFDLQLLSVSDSSLLQADALALWPDGSVKSALLQVKTEPNAGVEEALTVTYGKAVAPQVAESRISIRKGKESWVVNTGAIEASLSLQRFSPLGHVRSVGAGGRTLGIDRGFVLQDEAGMLFKSNNGGVEKIAVERLGAVDAVIRAEGRLQNEREGVAPQLRYIVRTRFFTDSARVEVAVTFINDRLEYEFSDLRMLSHVVEMPVGEGWKALVDTGNGFQESNETLFARQWNERVLEMPAGKHFAQRSSGSLLASSKAGAIRFAYHDFWQRWPKGVMAEPGRLVVELLPQQPEGFGGDLPAHLRFPFVEGCYRLKWGMAFTERFAFDFSDGPGLAPPAAPVSPVVRIPLVYLAETGVFGAFPLEPTPLVARWNDYMAQSMEAFLSHRAAERQYGYLNWGDWFGERGRNWGNNEYDIPHGFFRQYLFTHDERFFDAAVQGVRHQADVDIIHAYPDPYFVGANAQHAIGHTGITYHKMPARWSFAYGDAAHAGNGHTWADGMADAWLLTGDAVVMESLLRLGEHIRFAYVASRPEMGNHHRSFGWAALAAAATYRATSDPEYLIGIRTLLATPIAQWDKESGIWPYELAAGHARGRAGVHGSSIYNLGILLHGLARYHEITGDPQVPTVLKGAGNWLIGTFREGKGWPYSATADGSAIGTRLTLNLNPLIYPSLAYIGARLDAPRASQVATEAVGTTLRETVKDHLPKEFSIKAYATLEALALLEEAPSPLSSPATP